MIDPVYVAETATTCEIEVREFCLTSMTASQEEGRFDFEFDLQVVAAPVCENLQATLDIVDTQGEYLGNVKLNHDELIDAIECDCDKHFIVTADATGLGDYYGQIDIREASSGLIEIQDSCVYTNTVDQ